MDAALEDAILAGKFEAMADRAIRDAEAGKNRPLGRVAVKTTDRVLPASSPG